ncbi:hypothetical protein [Christiangramia crocea]|uniref:Calcineurin-like phosphoesterase domain-containing protein n=1 Tax=Christiangramia crocea TaxID=2904124 RepID=A0A9X1UV62_9FLAO|nr:hypothetical protein [Gramella crocea]MCG9970977.1 hypothetical protein [Gramella crocea]
MDESKRVTINDPSILKKLNLDKNATNRYRLKGETLEQYQNLVEENNTLTDTNNYTPKGGFTAVGEDGKMMDIKKYCSYYDLDFTKVRSYKLVTHTAVPYYNIAFYETVLDTDLSSDEFKDAIEKGLRKFKYTKKTTAGTGTTTIKISDLHFGAYVENLLRTQNFSIDILREDLRFAAARINAKNHKKVHIHLLGDLIESFTGLNHKNSWKGIDKFTIGSKAVMMCSQVLHEDFLSQINNLDCIKIVAGNHDRVTSSKDEDTNGEAAELIAWGLRLMGYNVEFHPLVIKHIVDGICHILMHGDKAISKKSAEKICWDYGEQGMFNLICLGHLHATIQSLTIKQRDSFKEVEEESVDHIKMHCPSIFTGNQFSEYLGFTTRKAIVSVEDNGKGIPDINNLAL